MFVRIPRPRTRRHLTEMLLASSLPRNSDSTKEKKEPEIYIARPMTESELTEAAAYRREMKGILRIYYAYMEDNSQEAYTKMVLGILNKETKTGSKKPILVEITLPEGVHCACNATDGLLTLESQVVAWEHNTNRRIAFEIRCTCCTNDVKKEVLLAQGKKIADIEPPTPKKRYVIRIVNRAPSSGSESSCVKVFETLEEASIYAQKYLTDTCNFYGWRDDKGWDSWKDMYEEGASRPTASMGSVKRLCKLLDEDRYDALIWGPVNTFRDLVPDEIRITET